jgi:hypothetical protein
MALTDLTSTQLEKLVGLIHEKEALQAKITQIDLSLQALEAGEMKVGKPVVAKRGPKPGRRAAPLKDALLAKLQPAGKEGIAVKDLAAKLGVKPTSVSIWFYTTGKKIKGIKRVGRARFAYLT